MIRLGLFTLLFIILMGLHIEIFGATSSTLEIERTKKIEEYTKLRSHLNQLAAEINKQTPRLIYLEGQIQTYNDILGTTDTLTTRTK